jgi:hypothetical protein
MKKSAIALLASGTLLLAIPAAAITVDGTAEGGYGAAVAIQGVQTQFGDASDGQPGFCNGSELDAAYAVITGGVLHLHLAGNLQSNFNKLEVFFDSKSGGQNKLRGDNPNVDFNGLNRMGDDGSGNGLTFDSGFESDYWMSVTGGDSGGYQMFANYAETPTGGGGTGNYLGQTGAASSGMLSGGTNPDGILATIDNGNTAGVGGGCDAASGGGVAKGVEIAIPLSALGIMSGCVKICAFVNGGGHDFLANQVLGSLTPSECNLGEPRLVNFAQKSGDQYFTICDGSVGVEPTDWSAFKTLYK